MERGGGWKGEWGRILILEVTEKEAEKDVKEGPFDKFKEVSFLGFVWMKEWGEFDSYNH